jgi:hypothetical protein
MTGTWVLTFPTMKVAAYGVDCASSSGTVVQVEQDGNHLVAPFSQGLLACPIAFNDTIDVTFAQGRMSGTVDGNRVDLDFEGAAGYFTGTVNGASASGEISYTDQTYAVSVTGQWVARRRTPEGAMHVSVATTSMNGQPLPSIYLIFDGDTAVQAPQNGMIALEGLTGGRHLIRVGTGGQQSCAVGGGPSGSLGGLNPNDQYFELVESRPPMAIAYLVTCT